MQNLPDRERLFQINIIINVELYTYLIPEFSSDTNQASNMNLYTDNTNSDILIYLLT